MAYGNYISIKLDIQKMYVHISWGIYKHAQQKRICIFYEKQELPRGKSQTKRILKACYLIVQIKHNSLAIKGRK